MGHMMVRSTRVRPLVRAALAAAAALMLSGCLDAVQRPSVVANANAAPDLPGGGSEDFVVNVGRRTYFREGSTELDSVAKETLDKQADWLKRYPRWKVKIQGFADDPGSKEANVSVSAKRAQAVRAYLVAQGVSSDRLYAKGYGRERLVRDCADLSCKSQNRRVITNLEGDRDL
jgi:peptidoglycan-associated lipoprotein